MASAPVTPFSTQTYRQPTRSVVRIATIAGEAQQAVHSALQTMPESSRALTLDELSFGAQAEAAIAIARASLSPPMYKAFLRWGEAAAHLSTRYEDDEDGNQRCDVCAEATALVGATPCRNVQDALYQNYLLTIEAVDTSAFGALADGQGSDTTLGHLAVGVTSALRSFSPLVEALDDLAASAWRASPKKLLALSPAIGGQITAAFRAARTMRDDHAQWLQERNDLMVFCNAPASMSEDEHDRALSRLSELELLILDTPATSQDDLLAQMVLATQLSAEGSTIDEGRAKRLVDRSITLVSMGTLAGTASGAVK